MVIVVHTVYHRHTTLLSTTFKVSDSLLQTNTRLTLADINTIKKGFSVNKFYSGNDWPLVGTGCYPVAYASRCRNGTL